MAGRMASHLRSFRNARSPSAAATIVPSGVERGGKTPAAFLPIPRPGSPYTPTPEAVRAAVAQTRWGNHAVLGWQPQGTPPAIRGVDTRGLRFLLIDAEELVLGRLAAQISTILQGKSKPSYCQNRDMGDVCVVVNAEKVHLSGKKLDQMVYRWHTGYPGGLKERTVRQQLERKPEEVLKRAVSRMLPKNKLRVARLRKLRLFVGPVAHGFARDALIPWEMPPRNIRSNKNDTELFELPEGEIPLDYRGFSNTDAYEALGEDDLIPLHIGDPSHKGRKE